MMDSCIVVDGLLPSSLGEIFIPIVLFPALPPPKISVSTFSGVLDSSTGLFKLLGTRLALLFELVLKFGFELNMAC